MTLRAAQADDELVKCKTSSTLGCSAWLTSWLSWSCCACFSARNPGNCSGGMSTDSAAARALSIPYRVLSTVANPVTCSYCQEAICVLGDLREIDPT